MANCSICNKKMGTFEGSSISIERDLSQFRICGTCSACIRWIKEGDVNSFRKMKTHIESITNSKLKEYLFDISKDAMEKERIQIEKENFEEKVKAEFDSIKVTTGYNFEGYKIVEYKNVISGECVLGTGFLSEFAASLSDLTGTNSGMFSEKLKDAKTIAMGNMKRSCIYEGGNAIIGIDFDYITFANNMIGVVANGTSVVIEKN